MVSLHIALGISPNDSGPKHLFIFYFLTTQEGNHILTLHRGPLRALACMRSVTQWSHTINHARIFTWIVCDTVRSLVAAGRLRVNPRGSLAHQCDELIDVDLTVAIRVSIRQDQSRVIIAQCAVLGVARR